MNLDPVKNFAKVLVSIGYDASATTIVLATGEGAKLPQPSTDGAFNLVWHNVSDYPDPSNDPNVEIIRVTARTDDTLTVTRAQEGTSAATHNTAGKSYQMILGITKKTIDDIDTNKLDTMGTAAKATILETARTINGVSFDGSANIIITDFNQIFKFQELEYADGVSDVAIANRVNAISFPASGTPKGTLKLDLKNFDLTKDILFMAIYCMSSAVTGTNAVKLQASYKVFPDTADLTTFVTTDVTEEFTVPTTARTKIDQTFTTLKIPYTALSSQDDFILFDLSRLNTGLSGINHTGNFELISLIAYQAV